MRNRLGVIAGVMLCSAVCLGFMAFGQNKDGPAGGAKKPAAKTALPAPAKAAAAPDKSSEEADVQAIRDTAAAYVKAYNAHDAKALAALFALKAEFIDEDEQLIKGREAIEANFTEVFKTLPKTKLNVVVDSVRLLTPNIAVEEGTVRSQDDPDAAEDVSTYLAVHVKVDGKWLVASVRDYEEAGEGDLTPHDRLQEIAWLVGEWVDESPEATVHTNCRWADNGNFLLQDFKVQSAGKFSMSGSMRIGWDPLTHQFKSWVFDSEGGHYEGLWIREGDEWMVKSNGVTPDGQTASSTNVYRYVDNETFSWRSYDRIVGGQMTEDVPEFIVKRAAPPPSQ